MRALLLIIALLVSQPVLAVQPDEVLADRVLETRAREISAELRCMVCQNQSIDDSDAPLARDLRVLVRQRLVAGDTDEGVRDYLVSRYGQFVLLRPRLAWGTAMLWGTPVVLLVFGGVLAWLARRGGSGDGRPDAQPLNASEEAALSRLLEGDR